MCRKEEMKNSKQLKDIFESGELQAETVVSKMETTAAMASGTIQTTTIWM